MARKEPDTMFTRAGPTRAAFLLGKYLPPTLGHVVARIIATVLLWRKPDTYYGALENLPHVLPPGSTPRDLRRAIRQVFYYSARGYYDLFHNLARPDAEPSHYQPPVKLAPGVDENMKAAVATGRGLMLLGSHMSNFDLGGIALSYHTPLPPQALSLAEPAPGFEFVNALRESRGRGEITPITPDSLRHAIERLRGGGVVITGVDRPLAEGNEPVTFFGETAYLPTGYMRIPLIADCLFMTVSFVYEPGRRGGTYWVVGNPPMEVVRTGNRKEDVRVNVQRVLAQVEDFIRRAPDQWMVFKPVWRPFKEGAPNGAHGPDSGTHPRVHLSRQSDAHPQAQPEAQPEAQPRAEPEADPRA